MTADELAQALDEARSSAGARATAAKLKLLRQAADSLPEESGPLRRIHEAALFLRAFPDSPAVLRAADDLLGSFAPHLAALGRRRPALLDAVDEEGMAGTGIYASFSLPVVRWLVRRFGGSVQLYAEDSDLDSRLGEVLPRLVSPAEAEALADGYLGSREWLQRTGARDGTRGLARLIGLVEASAPDEAGRERLWAALEPTVRWDLGARSGSRTLARAAAGRRVWRRTAAGRGPVDLAAEIERGPLPVRRAGRGEARRLIDLGLAAITARLREMHTFSHASPDDVYVANGEDGLRVVLYGVEPERRHALRTFYGYLLLRNEVPIGYGDLLLVLDWGELNFHIFDTFRQAASSRIYAEVARIARHRFGLRWLFLNRYQFGHLNEDAIRSGAFWFYAKLGFSPGDPRLRELVRTERRRLARDPAHRTPAAVLRTLARGHMALSLDPDDPGLGRRLGGFHPLHIGLAVTRHIEARRGGDRARAVRKAARGLRRLLPGRFRGGERRALERLAPILDLVEGLEGWPEADLAALADLVRLKAGREEREFLAASRRHQRFARAIVALGQGPGAKA